MKNREDFSELSKEELEEKFRHFKEELFNLRFQVVTGQLANPSRIRLVKRNIARVQTFLNRMEAEKVKTMLKEEYDSMISKKGIDPKKATAQEKISMLKEQLSHKALQVKREIKTEVDVKVVELIGAIREAISKKLRTVKGKEEDQLRASSKRLRDPKFTIRKKFLDKLSSMGLNEASQIVSLKETKRVKLSELDRINVLKRELTAGRLPF